MQNRRAFHPAQAAALFAAALVIAGPAAADQVIPDDLIVQGSTCTGFDCINNESFGFDTLRLKENNLRIHFDDTSTSAGYPANDWRLLANDTNSGGANYFAIEDSTAGRIPFRVEAGAPANALYVDSTGNIGISTSAPLLDLHMTTGDTPAWRLEQTNASGFTAQTWDVAGNEANFFVRDLTGGSRLPFRIRPGAPTSSLDIAANGNVGIGTASPALTGGSSDRVLSIVGSTNPILAIQNTTANKQWGWYVNSDGNLVAFDAASTANRLAISLVGNVGIGTITPATKLQVNGNIAVVALPANPAGQTMCFGTQGGVANTFGNCTSDLRLKREVQYLQDDSGLNAVMQLKPATYKWHEGDDRVMAGFIAQDTQRAIPEAVFQSKDAEFLSLDSTAVLSYAVKAIQELKADNESLRAEIQTLKALRYSQKAD